MSRWIAAVVVGGMLGAAVVMALPATATGSWPRVLHTGGQLHAGQRLVSANGRYSASVSPGGRLAVRRADGRIVWATRQTGSGAVLVLRRTGQLVLRVGRDVRWRTGTAGSGDRDVLTLRDNGVLALTNGRLLVWSSRVPNRCPLLRGRTVVVDIGAQRARMCSGGQQLRTTLVTTGASALGYATPTGTWRVYDKVRDTTLYPAAGGAYPVKYWMPYDGPYGMHDSPWQRFPYGSQLYRTRGSHGCVHLPGRAMAWLFNWAPVGTRVRVHG
jgi:hypothetical protein